MRVRDTGEEEAASLVMTVSRYLILLALVALPMRGGKKGMPI